MALEQQMERSEELLETNEQNKERVEDARQWVRQAGNQVNAAQAQVQYAQAQLRQAIADRNAAQQRASQEENGSVPASYDSAVAAAEAELSAANRELQESRREQIAAERELSSAEGALEQSSRELRSVADELQQVSEKYGVEMGKTRALLSLPHSHLASPLLQQLGIGQGRVNDLRQRIAVSLGISMAATSSGYGGYGGGRSGGRQRAVAGGGGGIYGGSIGTSGGTPHIHTPTVSGSSAPAASGSSASSAVNGSAANAKDGGNPNAVQYPCQKTVNGEKHYYDSRGVLYRVGDGLLPHTISVINGYQITTDGLGRKSCVEGKLHLRERDRLNIKDSMSVIGKGDQKEYDDRGHLIADLFDGPNGLENLVPQNSVLNRGDFKKFEGELAQAVREENEVYARVEPYYEGNSNRPSEIAVFYSINGERFIRIFQNE